MYVLQNYKILYFYISLQAHIISIYDFGTETISVQDFATNIIKTFCKSMIPVRICTDFCVDSESAIKTRFKAFFKN